MNVVNGTVYDTDSAVIKGTVSGTGSLKGGVSTLYAKDGASAYEVARANGFVGTVDEWLASLKGERGNPGIYIGSGEMPEDCNVQINPNGKAIGIAEIERLFRPARVTTIELPSSAWIGSDNIYSQIVTIDGITEYSKIDLLPSVEQLAIFYEKDLAFATENEDGVVTVYAIGDKPANDYTMQASITEVAV